MVIMTTILLLMSINTMNVEIIIIALNVLNYNRPVPGAMVYVEEMVGVFMFMLEEVVRMEGVKMMPVSIAPMIAMMVTIKL